MDVASIARSGMAAASAQLAASASNLANQQSRAQADQSIQSVGMAAVTGRPDGPYIPLRVVQTSLTDGARSAGTQVSVVPDQGAETSEYDPGSPYANPHGYAVVPNVDVVHETVNTIMATFAFEANLAVLQTSDDLTRAFLDSMSSRGDSRFDP